ncbi:hypothetical protein P8932_16535 [Bacillus atrophaeus]|nr:hypothetical protein [Bacillus atrophaeus]MEC0886571.1 hypothetical protein [Bacillus atrophaeus]
MAQAGQDTGLKPSQLQPHLNDVHTVFGKVTRGVMKELLYKLINHKAYRIQDTLFYF